MIVSSRAICIEVPKGADLTPITKVYEIAYLSESDTDTKVAVTSDSGELILVEGEYFLLINNYKEHDLISCKEGFIATPSAVIINIKSKYFIRRYGLGAEVQVTNASTSQYDIHSCLDNINVSMTDAVDTTCWYLGYKVHHGVPVPLDK